MSVNVRRQWRLFALAGTVGVALAGQVFGQQQASRFTQADVGVSNSTIKGQGILTLDTGFAQGDHGEAISASLDHSFTGLDGDGNQQTTHFTGTLSASADFGQLHSTASGSVTNTYYNANNPTYDPGSDTGSPDGYASLGFAGFTDVLQYGAPNKAGYNARYIFHISGNNEGYGSAADLSVTIAGTPFSFFDFNPGPISEDWATDDVPVTGDGSQIVNVQFSDQFGLNAFDVADGSDVSGTADFNDTITLEAVIETDPDGNVVNNAVISTASGTTYPTPEPTAVAILLPTALALFARRRRQA